MTWDEMKIARDGWLKWGRSDQPRPPYIRPVFAFIERLPNGNVVTTDGGAGAIEWGPDDKPSGWYPASRRAGLQGDV